MKASVRLFRVSGIPIGLHWSVLALGLFASYNLAVNFLPLASPGGTLGWYLLASVIGVVGLAGSVLLHELGHALVAQREGVPVRSINLWALGGAAHLGDQPPSPGAALRISAAGPAVSLALAVLAGVPALAFGFLTSSATLPITVLGYFGLVNLGLGLFNLIPALPLDGGRILQAVVWKRTGDRHAATIQAAGVGRFLGGLIIALGLWLMLTGNSGLWTVLIGLFVRHGASAERRHAIHSIRLREAQARAEAQRAKLGARPSILDFLNDLWQTPGNANSQPGPTAPFTTSQPGSDAAQPSGPFAARPSGPFGAPPSGQPRQPRTEVIEGTLIER